MLHFSHNNSMITLLDLASVSVPSSNITMHNICLHRLSGKIQCYCLVFGCLLCLCFSLFLSLFSRLLRPIGDVADTTCRGFSVAQKTVKGFTVFSMTMTRSSVALGTIPSRYVYFKIQNISNNRRS